MREIKSNPKPFVRWAGGKRQVIKLILPLLPNKFGAYFEPFLGGGALFFSLGLANKKVFINDLNPYLIGAFSSLKDKKKFNSLLPKLQDFQKFNSKEFYYNARTKFNESSQIDTKIDLFFYLNKVSFNGLYRENKNGHYNVPYNNNHSTDLFDFKNLLLVHNYLNLNNVVISNKDYKELFSNVVENDFVYFDPPYDSPNIPKSFTKYNAEDFSRTEQIALRDLCVKLSQKGVKIMVSNHDTPFIRELYNGNIFNVSEISVSRSINSVPTKRGKVKEVIIRNYNEK